MRPHEFFDQWRSGDLSEHAAAQLRFVDHCTLLAQSDPVFADGPVRLKEVGANIILAGLIRLNQGQLHTRTRTRPDARTSGRHPGMITGQLPPATQVLRRAPPWEVAPVRVTSEPRILQSEGGGSAAASGSRASLCQ